jgi:sigma-E factor negative regulatory protein RseA
MTERIKEQISVFMDDELSSQECEFFVRRLQREPESRRQFVRYQVIGAAIRGERVIANHGDLRARLQVALDGDHDVLTRPQGRGRFGRLAAGAGIAAAVAAVACLAVRFAIWCRGVRPKSGSSARTSG